MALLFMDSFDNYVTADLLEKWTTTAVGGSDTLGIQAAAGRRSSGGLRHAHITNSNAGSASKVLTASGATAIVGVALKMPTPAFYTGVLTIVQATSAQVSLRVNTDLTLSVYRGAFNSGTLLGTTVTPIVANVFAYLELKVLLSTTVGTIDLRVNGASVLALTSQNTQATGSATWTAVALGQHAAGGSDANNHTKDFDDLYVLDGSGAAPWNDFLGDCRVDVCVPTGAGATTGWTPSAGANWQCVDDAAPNDDTDYTSAASAGLVDTFVVQDAPVAGAAIYGVQHCLSVKKTDAGIATIAPVIRHSGVDYVGADLFPATGYAYALAIAATNPGTGVAWTDAGFNAAEFGYKRTT